MINGKEAETHWRVDLSYDGQQAGHQERGRRDCAGRLCSVHRTMVKIRGRWVPTLYDRLLCTDGCEGDLGRTMGGVFDAQRERQARQEMWDATKLARARAKAERLPCGPASHCDPGALEGKDDHGRRGDVGGVRASDDVVQDAALAQPVDVAGDLDRTVFRDGNDGGLNLADMAGEEDDVGEGGLLGQAVKQQAGDARSLRVGGEREADALRPPVRVAEVLNRTGDGDQAAKEVSDGEGVKANGDRGKGMASEYDGEGTERVEDEQGGVESGSGWEEAKWPNRSETKTEVSEGNGQGDVYYGDALFCF